MKKVLLLTIAIMVCASLAYAQGGYIQLAADAGGLQCNYTFIGAPIYQIHQSSPGTTLSRYKIDFSNAPGVIYFADNYAPNSPLGASNTGVAVAYGSCKATPYAIGQTFVGGGFNPCDFLVVVPDPASTSGTIESIDCSLPTPIKYVAGGSILTFDPNGGGACAPGCGQVVPVRDTSWGKIKSLYN